MSRLKTQNLIFKFVRNCIAPQKKCINIIPVRTRQCTFTVRYLSKEKQLLIITAAPVASNNLPTPLPQVSSITRLYVRKVIMAFQPCGRTCTVYIAALMANGII